jgi:hypothetical protein
MQKEAPMSTLISILVNVTRAWRGGLFLLASTLLVNAAWAAGPDVCAALPLAKVNSIIHQNLTGVRPDVSEEAHSMGAHTDLKPTSQLVSFVRAALKLVCAR